VNTAFYKLRSNGRLQSPSHSHERWWRSFFDLSTDALLVCRADGSIEEANSRAIQLLGLNSDEESPVLLDCLGDADRARVEGMVARAFGPQESMHSVRIATSDGLKHVVDLQSTPLDGGFSLVLIRDVSQRWRMESHAKRLMAAVDATTDVIFMTDEEFRLTFVNSAFQTVTGYTIEEALGRPIRFLRAAGQDDLLEACHTRVLKEGDWNGALINQRQDGAEYPVEASTSARCCFSSVRRAVSETASRNESPGRGRSFHCSHP